VVIIEETKQGENTVEQHNLDVIPPPPFPERLMIEKPNVYPNFDIIRELKNLCVKIPLLQALQDIPIYAKIIKELCGKKPRRKTKNPSIVHVVGTLSNIILGKHEPVKYIYPWNLVVTIQIQGCFFPNTLVDLGETINIMTIKTCNVLGITSFKPTSTMLELVDRSMVKPVGTLQDIAISIDSWE
jgi:hypothetical protein